MLDPKSDPADSHPLERELAALSAELAQPAAEDAPPLFRNEGGEQAAIEAVERMNRIMADCLAFDMLVEG